MSIVSCIRDYVELLNSLSDSLGAQFTFSKFLTETCFYFLKTFQYIIYYVFSFQWIRDFIFLPVTIPQNCLAVFKENLFLESSSIPFFEFLEIPSFDQNKFILGFFNSFFLTLPITITHIVSFRRLIIQGFVAALFSFFGFILGQTLFIFCVTFGIRSLLIPWLSLEPLNYILGLILMFQIIYSMFRENLIPLKWNNYSHRRFFKKFFLTNLILSWCEQTCIFQYFSNITLTGHPSILEGFSTKTTLTSFFSHSSYIGGIFLGSILFSLFWIFIILQLKNFIIQFTGISLSRFVQTVNRASFPLLIGLTLSSVPFYSLDYLITGPLGFISQDSFIKYTRLGEGDRTNPHQGGIIKYEDYETFDISSFDRGHYLDFPKEDENHSFEDLNYRGEQAWIEGPVKLSPLLAPKKTRISLKTIFKDSKEIKEYRDYKTKQRESLLFKQSNIYVKANSLIPKEESFQYHGLSNNDSRFRDWYLLPEVDREDLRKKATPTLIEHFQKFNIYTFPLDFMRSEKNRPKPERVMKEKYYSNPLYKSLLAIDIDLFLNRQPSSAFLTGEHELDLYQKREILNSYYDSLRLYTKLPYSTDFEDFFHGTKSFTNKIYNQQFKGTLRSIRRLFCLSKTSIETISKKTNTLHSVLKYDQPLYENKFKFSPYHEEISGIEFEEENGGTNFSNTGKNLFLNEFISKPLYAGWDENLRKFVLTNKILSRGSAGYEITIPQEWSKKFQIGSSESFDKNLQFLKKPSSNKKGVFGTWNLSPGGKQEKQKQEKQKASNIKFSEKIEKIHFSVWPRPRADFNNIEVPFVALFQKNPDILKDTKDSSISPYLPSNLEIVQYKLVEKGQRKFKTEFPLEILIDNLVPKRGGFVWPGSLPFDFKNFYFEIISKTFLK